MRTPAQMLNIAKSQVEELSWLSLTDPHGRWIMPLIQARRLRDELQRVSDFEAMKAARAHIESSAGVPVTARSASRSGFDGTSFHPAPGQAQRIN